MKNIYLYGASDDCHELESDFGISKESYGDIYINKVLVEYVFDGNWGIKLMGDIPKSWIVKVIKGNCARKFSQIENAGEFIHIQIPEKENIEVYEKEND